jgi:outer membrane protein TolC
VGAESEAARCVLVITALTGCLRGPYAPASSSTPWRAPAELAVSEVPRRTTPLDPGRVYGLADLIDLAHRTNPATRRAWEEARAAAARVGFAEAAYYPTLTVMAKGGTSRIAIGAPMVGTITLTGPSLRPEVQLDWILLDFGRRSSEVDARREGLFEASFAFNRTLQEIAFAVARNYFALDASRARVTAARATLESALAVEDAVRARQGSGLATRPELLLAQQERARADFDLESALAGVDDAQAALAESLGIAPTELPQVADLSAVPLPKGLADSVERIIDRMLQRRPDIAASLAALRARDALQRRAIAEYRPRVSFAGSLDRMVQWYVAEPPPGHFTMNVTEYNAMFALEWTAFDGMRRENAVREARSLRDAAAADLDALQLRAVREVWQAYTDVKRALREHDYALALLAASQESYDATLASYRDAGLATVLDLLTAQRNLASARMTEIASRAQLLTASAALTFAAGD